MRTHQIFGSVFGLASVIGILISSTPDSSIPETSVACSPWFIMVFVRVLTWAWSAHGRAVISASIAASAILPYLGNHPLQEARELAAAILVLLLLLLIEAISEIANPALGTCATAKLLQ